MLRSDALQAILFLTHRLNDEIVARFDQIDVPGNYRKHILLDIQAGKHAVPPDLPVTAFDLNSICQAGYQPIFPRRVVPGSNHFPVIEFAANHSEYRFVWVIEFDVVFTGRWTNLFQSVPENVEFVATKIRRYIDDPFWPWWRMEHRSPSIPAITRDRLLASFNPIYRLGRGAACYLKGKYIEGWRGHHEVTIPTLLSEGGFHIEELGGTSAFTPSERLGRFYQIDETVRWRPSITLPLRKPMPNMLYHPVKCDSLTRQVCGLPL